MDGTQPLQPAIPAAQLAQARQPLPRLAPVEGPWLTVDSAYAGQMALRGRLIADRPAAVIATVPGAEPAIAALRDTVMHTLAADPRFTVAGDAVVRPDGCRVDTRGPELEVLGRIVAEDLCVMERRDGVHVLVAAVLCFPSSWTLTQKIGRPLVGIHAPVPEYDADIARRVQRLFDGARTGRPMWRANLLRHQKARLHNPMPEGAPKPQHQADWAYLRSERQTVLRLSEDAVLFAIHTSIVARQDVAEADARGG